MSSTKSAFARAQSFVRSGNPAEALALLQDLMKRTSRHQEEWWLAAFQAIAVAAQCKNNEANFELLKTIDEAVQVTNRRLEIVEEFWLYFGLASCYTSADDKIKASACLKKASLAFAQLPESEKDFQLTTQFAFACAKSELHQFAIDLMNAILKSKAKNTSVHRILIATDIIAAAYKQSGDESTAAKIRTEAFTQLAETYVLSSNCKPHEWPLLPEWGRDDFTNFLNCAHYNTIASVTSIPSIYDKLALMNAKFNAAKACGELHTCNFIKKNYGEIELSTLRLTDEERMEMFFLMRTHACLMAACTLGLAGQIAESYALMRAAIEHAIYAFKITSDETSRNIWLARRHDDKVSRSAVNKIFKPSLIFEQLKKENQQLEQELHHLYELTIDEGAHPNASTFFKHSIQGNDSDGLSIGLNYQDTDFIPSCVDDIVTISEACLSLFRHIYPSWVW